MLPLLVSLTLVLAVPASASSSVADRIICQLVRPQDVTITSSQWIHLGLVMANVGLEQHPEQYYVHRLDNVISSVLDTSHGHPVHIVFISDQESMEVISKQMEKTIGKFLTNRLLLNAEAWKQKYYKIPKLRVEFADMSEITETYRDTITAMRKHFDRGGDWFKVGIEGKENWSYQGVEKYSPDLFYISPFYHLVFPFEKFIVIDADIEFKHSLKRLYKEFDKFLPSQLFGLAKDMSPFYRTTLAQFREENPGTEHGEIGRLQGLNTGVALFHLEKMRESGEFAEYLQHDTMDRVCDKFHFKSFIGDQDWWNIVVWDQPDLLYFLDCGFNFQLKQEFNRPPFDKYFADYHQCESEMMIKHGHNM